MDSNIENDMPAAQFIRFMVMNVPGYSSGGLIWKTNYGSGYTNVSAKKEVLSRAEKKRRKDLEKLEKMNSSMNSYINSLLGR